MITNVKEKKGKNFPNTYTLQPVKIYYMKYPILHGASLSPTLGKNKNFSMKLMNSRYPIQFQNTIPLGWGGCSSI